MSILCPDWSLGAQIYQTELMRDGCDSQSLTTYSTTLSGAVSLTTLPTSGSQSLASGTQILMVSTTFLTILFHLFPPVSSTVLNKWFSIYHLLVSHLLFLLSFVFILQRTIEFYRNIFQDDPLILPKLIYWHLQFNLFQNPNILLFTHRFWRSVLTCLCTVLTEWQCCSQGMDGESR